MTRSLLLKLALAASALSLASAFFFQYVLAVLPCHLCILQRWPHAAMVVLAALGLALPGRLVPWIGSAVAAVSIGLAVFHSGVERKLWAGPSSCTGGQDLSGLSGSDLLSTDFADAVVQCDQINFAILGLTFANWNVLLSLVLLGIWLAAARQN